MYKLDYVSVITRRRTTASKTWVCQKCYNPIKKGERHDYWAWREKKRLYNARFHISCPR